MPDDAIRPRGPYRGQLRRTPSKTRRRPFVPLERDVAMLRALYTHRFLDFELLLALFPPGEAPAAALEGYRAKVSATPRGGVVGRNLYKRLRLLFDARLVDRFYFGMGAPLIYGLTRAGATLLRTRQQELPFPPEIDWTERNRRLSRENILHALMTSRVGVAIEVGIRELPGVVLEPYDRECIALLERWRTQRPPLTVNFHPDAYLRVTDTRRAGANARTFFVEADMGGMSFSRLLEKFERYAAFHAQRDRADRFGIEDFRVLTVVTSATRVENLLRLISGRPLAAAYRRTTYAQPSRVLRERLDLFLFVDEKQYRQHPANFLARIWYAADNPDAPTSILPVSLPFVRSEPQPS